MEDLRLASTGQWDFKGFQAEFRFKAIGEPSAELMPCEQFDNGQRVQEAHAQWDADDSRCPVLIKGFDDSENNLEGNATRFFPTGTLGPASLCASRIIGICSFFQVCSNEANELLKASAKRAVANGRYSLALCFFNQMLSSDSADLASVHSDIAFVYKLLGNTEKHEYHLGEAIKNNPLSAIANMNNGVFLFEKGRYSDARRFLECACRLDSYSSTSFANLGVLEIYSGNIDLASSLLSKALEIDHSNEAALSALFDLCVLKTDSDLDLAIPLFFSQYSDSDTASKHKVVSEWLLKAGRCSDSLEQIRQSIQLAPSRVDLHLSMSSLLISLGRSDEAIEFLLYSLTIEPENLNLLIRLAYAYQDIGEIACALGLYEEVYGLEPLNVEVANLIGCCQKLSRMEFSAIRTFEAALQVNPHHLPLLENLASSLSSVGRHSDAINCYTQLLSLHPLLENAFYNLMFTYSTLSRNYILPSLERARDFWSGFKERNRVDGQVKFEVCDSGPAIDRHITSRARGKIRVGVISSEIGDHVVGQFLAPFLQYYNRDCFDVTLIISTRRYEQTALELVALASDSIGLYGLTYMQAVKQIRKKRFDIIIETSGYTSSTQIRLLSSRLAPVQCHYIGYHASTGLDTIDYFIGDEEITPTEFEADFSEEIIRLPRTWLTISYHQVLPVAVSVAATDRMTFGSFNQAAKFNNTTYDYWAAVLIGIPSSILLVKDSAMQDPEMVKSVIDCMANRGVGADRLRFFGPQKLWRDHMSIYNVVDVCLDCTPWSGSTTVFDALSMGTPYLAIRGDCTSSRMSSSIVKGFGQPDWAVSSIDEYVELARQFAGQIQALRDSKRAMQLRALSSQLHDARSGSHALEEAFTKIVAKSWNAKT